MRAAPGATRGFSLPRRARRCPALGSPIPEPAAMGAAESFPATPPSKPFLRHLAHVSDPRSPTPGILRTPIEVESSPQRSSSGGEMAADQSQTKEAETASDQRQSWDPRSPTLGISRTPLKAAVAGGKPTRRKASNKVLAVSGGTGRSPLSILQDDNSPSTLSSRQGKRHPSLAENLGEWKEVAADPGCNVKSGGSVWNDSNKENQHCRLVEN